MTGTGAKPVDPPCDMSMPHTMHPKGMHEATIECPPNCPRRLAREELDAKPVDPVLTDAQVIEESCRPAGANPVDTDGGEDWQSDAKAVGPGESIGDFVQRALGIALAAPFRPSEPPIVSPRIAELYEQAQVADEWPDKPYLHEWGGNSIRPVPQDPGPGPFLTPLPGEPRTIRGGITYPGSDWLDGFVRNTYAFRAEVPPSTADAVAKADAKLAAAKVKARRTKARRVGRVARDRGRGIRPCTCDCDRSDW